MVRPRVFSMEVDGVNVVTISQHKVLLQRTLVFGCFILGCGFAFPRAGMSFPIQGNGK